MEPEVLKQWVTSRSCINLWKGGGFKEPPDSFLICELLKPLGLKEKVEYSQHWLLAADAFQLLVFES
jgi:hypothetical protein